MVLEICYVFYHNRVDFGEDLGGNGDENRGDVLDNQLGVA